MLPQGPSMSYVKTVSMLVFKNAGFVKVINKIINIEMFKTSKTDIFRLYYDLDCIMKMPWLSSMLDILGSRLRSQ